MTLVIIRTAVMLVYKGYINVISINYLIVL